MRHWIIMLLLASAVVGTSLLAFGTLGLIVAPVFLGIIAISWSSRRKGAAVLLDLCVAFLALGLFAILHMAYHPSREPSRRMVCANYVLEIGRALYNYQGVHGTLPPAHLLDKDGKPLHSWRLLLLPHIEESILYGQFDLTQPWNARRNDYWRQPVCLYQCPNDGHGMQATTRYLAVVGPDSLWGKRWGITDDAGQADRRTPAVVVEVPDSDVRWAEPRDITLEEACTILASANVSGASGRHSIPGNFFFEEVVGANVLFADGSVMFVPTGWPREMLAGALAGDPAEIAALARFQESAKRRINWPRCASVAGLVLAVAAMMFWPRRAVTRPSEAEPAKAGETCPVRPA